MKNILIAFAVAQIYVLLWNEVFIDVKQKLSLILDNYIENKIFFLFLFDFFRDLRKCKKYNKANKSEIQFKKTRKSIKNTAFYGGNRVNILI